MNYRPEIDGLRAVAVLPVVAFHAGLPGFSGGYLGVDVFFVISGFLITSIVAGQIEAGTFSLVHFYERRARRLMPALFAVLAAVAVGGWIFSFPDQRLELGESLVAVCLYVSNVLFWQRVDYFATDTELNPLLHTWSLAVEEQFYLFFPTLLMLGMAVLKRNVRWAVLSVGLLSLLAAHITVADSPETAFYLAHTRAWELMVGAMLALTPEAFTWIQGKRGIATAGAAVGLTSLIAAMGWFTPSTPTPSLWTGIPVLGTALILLCAQPDNLIGRVLALKPLVHIGLISYSLYLWHQPVLAFAKQSNVGTLQPGSIAILIAISFVLAELSWRFVEAPFRSPSIARRWIFGGTAAASAAFLVIGAFTATYEDAEGRQSFAEQALLAAAPGNPRVKKCHWRDGHPKNRTPCQLGVPKGVPSVVLYGDSHADVLAAALGERLAKVGRTGIELTYSGCAPVRGINRPDRGRKHRCAIFNEFAMRAIEGDPVDTVILSARWGMWTHGNRFDAGGGCRESTTNWDVEQRIDKHPHVTGTDFDARMKSSLQTLIATGKRIVIVHPTPEQGCDVPKAVAKIRKRGGTMIQVDRPLFEARMQRAETVLDSLKGENVFHIETIDLFCDDRGCPGEKDGEILYSDDDHLNRAGAERVFQKIDALGLW